MTQSKVTYRHWTVTVVGADWCVLGFVDNNFFGPKQHLKSHKVFSQNYIA